MMPRQNRAILSQKCGLNHIYSRITGGEHIIGDIEKEHLLNLVSRYAAGFFVTIHSFAIMSNHFHLLISEGQKDAQNASKEELLTRYHSIFGEDADPPWGIQRSNGQTVPDEDGGIERLRTRLGSVSRFVQEIKQSFTNWYNARHDRKGYLWGGRFGSQQVEKGDASLISSAYVDLNAVRAGMAASPEEFRWCSMGLRARDPVRARKMLRPLPIHEGEAPLSETGYRLLVYQYGS